jgi:carboxyl-terminal processing protease
MGTSIRKLTPRRRVSGALLGLLLVTGCTMEPTSLAAQSPAVGEHVFAVGYSRIAEIYLEPVDMGKLTLDGLSGLANLDSSLHVDRDGGLVRLTANGHAIGEFPAPPPNDASGWAALTAQAIDRARMVSRSLRTASMP